MHWKITALWGGKKVESRETQRAVTPFGGLVVFCEFLRQVGYRLREWMELRTHVFGNVDVFGDFNSDDSADIEWRGRVAQVLIENGLAPKANRYVECCCYGVRLQCKGSVTHELFSPRYCDLRYCPRCGPRQFARLIEKHSPAINAVCKQKKR